MATKLLVMFVNSKLSFHDVRVYSVGLFTLHKVQVIRLNSGSILYFSGTLRRYMYSGF